MYKDCIYGVITIAIMFMSGVAFGRYVVPVDKSALPADIIVTEPSPLDGPPVPTTDLQVQIAVQTTEFGRTMALYHIYTANEEAAAWVEREAPRFGKLLTSAETGEDFYALFVNPVYDADEVHRYLLSYNKK